MRTIGSCSCAMLCRVRIEGIRYFLVVVEAQVDALKRSSLIYKGKCMTRG